jgi:uncharacterized membrane protein
MTTHPLTTPVPVNGDGKPARRPHPRASGGSPLYRGACAVENTVALDRVVRAVDRALPAALAEGPVRDVLGGRWLGHAFHPLLTDFPLGAWMAASLLDILPGADHDDASQRLLAFGLVMVLPTVASGWSDWTQADRRERRVGIVHAVTNGTAASCYAASLVARRAGRRRLAVAFGLTGGVLATVGGFFGGHMSTARDTALRASATATG